MLYFYYYPHTSRDSVSPVCGIFGVDIAIVLHVYLVKMYFIGHSKNNMKITNKLESYLININLLIL